MLSELINFLFYEPIFNLLILIYKYVGSLGIAIVGVALIHKIVTFSWTKKQIKSAERNQEMQGRMNAIKKKYKNNQEKQTKELAKVQAEYMPGMMGGCLNMIISLVLLIQVRSVVINLVNQGVHAFNKVAYAESMKYKEDSIEVVLPKDYKYGEHTLEYTINSTADIPITKEIVFGIAKTDSDVSSLEDSVKNYDNGLSDVEKEANAVAEREANIGLYIDQLSKKYVVVGQPDSLTAYLRPPSGESIVYDDLVVKLDGEVVGAGQIITNQGDSLNLEFLGADLSRVASDFNLTDFETTWPYITIAVAVGISQFFASKIQMGMKSKDDDKKKNSSKTNKNKGKKKSQKDNKEEEMPDFSEMMAESSKNMIYIFPVLTIMMSLGYMGGGSIFPAGVSLFWTAQNVFVIIQQVVMNKEKVQKYLEDKFNISLPKNSGGQTKNR